MFANEKVNKMYRKNLTVSEKQLASIKAKLVEANGNSYQQSIYSEFDFGVTWLNFGVDRDLSPIFALYGCYGDTCDLNSMRLGLVKVMQEQILGKGREKKGISLVYFSKCDQRKKFSKKIKSKNIQFSHFREEVLKQLEPRYFKLIKFVHVCHEGFLTRSLSYFSFQKSTIYTQAIDQMVKYHDGLDSIVRELGPLFDCQFISDDVQCLEANAAWLNIYSEKDKKEARKVFEKGKNKQQKGRLLFKNLQSYTENEVIGVPLLLSQLFQHITDRYGHVQGIFRKAADDQCLRQLENQLALFQQNKPKDKRNIQNQYQNILAKYDSDTVACCVKLFFTRLSSPLLNYTTYEEVRQKLQILYENGKKKQELDGLKKSKIFGEAFVPTQREIERIVDYLVQNLQKKQRDILLETVAFFEIAILKEQKTNRMSAENLSIVFAPCFFRSQEYSLADVVAMPRFVTLLNYLIQHPEKLLDAADM